MCLVFGAALNPAEASESANSAVRVATQQSGRWLAMAVLWCCASVALTAGMPAILSLFQTRAHRIGTLGVVVLSVGAIGTSGFAMLLVFVQALARHGAFKAAGLETVVNDTGLAFFLWIWVTGFYLGSLLVALALFISRATHVWVPIALVLFVVMLPLGTVAGEVGQVIQLMALALAFTGIATTAVNRTQPNRELSPN